MPNPTAAEVGLTQNQYDELVKADKLKPFLDVRNGTPNWNELGRRVAPAVANVLLGKKSEKRTANAMVSIIAERTALHPGENAGAEFGWGDDLANFLETGQDQVDPIRPVDPPPTNRLINIDEALVEISTISPFIPFEVQRALERVLARRNPVPVNPPATYSDLPPTTDPVEVIARMRSVPKHWPNGTQASNTQGELDLRAKRLVALKLDSANSNVAAEILEFKAAFDGLPTAFDSGLAVVDLNDWHARGWNEFVQVFTGKSGDPSGVR